MAHVTEKDVREHLNTEQNAALTVALLSPFEYTPPATSLSGWLSCAFDWEKTDEGYPYWSRVAEGLMGLDRIRRAQHDARMMAGLGSQPLKAPELRPYQREAKEQILGSLARNTQIETYATLTGEGTEIHERAKLFFERRATTGRWSFEGGFVGDDPQRVSQDVAYEGSTMPTTLALSCNICEDRVNETLTEAHARHMRDNPVCAANFAPVNVVAEVYYWPSFRRVALQMGTASAAVRRMAEHIISAAKAEGLDVQVVHDEVIISERKS